MTGQTGQTGQQGGGRVALLLARFAPPQTAVVPVQPVTEALEATQETRPVIDETWDEARAVEMQAAVHARLDEAVAAVPAGHPCRQARLNVLANERGIVVGLMAKRDPLLWGWLRSLECLLERWNEEDRTQPQRRN
jgi:hypothetical protein